MSAGLRIHGGPDAQGAARWDFSTCAHGGGPCPAALRALRMADPTRYPDPHSTLLRERLAALHGVAPARILIAASASEFIQRITAVGDRLLPGPVQVPLHAYGDYAAAAGAWQRRCVSDRPAAGGPPPTLRWIADPSSPCGQDAPPCTDPGAVPTVLDAVYAPLRLHGGSPWTDADRLAVFVLHSPNKALGLCGVRGAYALAPQAAAWDVDGWCRALEASSPSWPLSAQAVALLQAWTGPEAQAWLAETLPTLRRWQARLEQGLLGRGFDTLPSVTPFFCVRPPLPVPAAALRAHGVAVRDAASFGLPGWWRLAARPPSAIDALLRACDRVLAEVRR